MSNLFTKKFMKVPHLKINSLFKEIGRNAFVDWLLILILNICVAIALIIGGLYLYWQISTGNFISSQIIDKKEEKVFDEKELQTIVNRYEAKSDVSEQVKRGYRGPGDPSL